MVSGIKHFYLLQVFFLCLILFFLTAGVYFNLYIFKSFTPELVFSAALLPAGGALCGGLLSWICRLEWKLIKVRQWSYLLARKQTSKKKLLKCFLASSFPTLFNNGIIRFKLF